MRLPAFLRRRRPAAPVILMEHRVAAPAPAPWSLGVSPRHFAEQVEALRRHRTVLSLRQLVLDLAEGRLRPGAVAITFDDGYADNLHAALPVLERADVPATVFVSTGHLGRRAYWWDELAGRLLHDRPLPAVLRLPALGGGEWPLDDAPSPPGWRAADGPATARQAAYLAIWQRMRALPDAAQRRVLDEVAAAVPDAGAAAGDAGRPMTAAEAARLAASRCIEIGAHTATHPALPGLSRGDQYREIRAGRSACEAIAGGDVRSFAYPYGDLSPESIELVRACGFDSACSTEAAAVGARSDRHALPRLAAGDVDGDRLLDMIGDVR